MRKGVYLMFMFWNVIIIEWYKHTSSTLYIYIFEMFYLNIRNEGNSLFPVWLFVCCAP